MKAQDERPNLPEMPPYRLGRHWNTIQAYLIPGIEDDIGELSEEMKKFMGICELLIDDKMFAKYRWCGNGRPPRHPPPAVPARLASPRARPARPLLGSAHIQSQDICATMARRNFILGGKNQS